MLMSTISILYYNSKEIVKDKLIFPNTNSVAY